MKPDQESNQRAIGSNPVVKSRMIARFVVA